MFARFFSTISTAIVLVAIVGVGPASAHTERLQSSPAPAQLVGGVVDFVDFIFTEPISNMQVTIEQPDGELVDGQMVVSEGQLIRYEMPAISQVGRYLIRYSLTSADDDLTESVYFFDYDPQEAQPLRLGEAQVPPNESNQRTPIVVSLILAMCLVGLAMIYLSRVEKNRLASAASEADQ